MSRMESCAPTMERPRPSGPPATPTPEHLTLRARPARPMVDGPRPDGGPEARFEALYRSEFRSIVAIVTSLTGRRDVAEEIVQDAFVVTHDRWSRIDGYERPADFVRRVALNRALSSLRRRQAEHRALTRFEGGAGTAALIEVGADDESGLWAAVRRLPARQAQAVALLYVEDQPIPRIAEIIGCSENTVKTHLKRARATLAKAMAAGAPDQEGGIA